MKYIILVLSFVFSISVYGFGEADKYEGGNPLSPALNPASDLYIDNPVSPVNNPASDLYKGNPLSPVNNPASDLYIGTKKEGADNSLW